MHTTSDIAIDMVSIGAHVVLSTGDEIIKDSSCGALVRALASYQCGRGSIPRLVVTCSVNVCVLYSALKGFSSGSLSTTTYV